jgi:ABC-type transport system involved in multi-copper enzyme maturation permease subunit
MKPGPVFTAARWLLRDTLHQALSSGVFWFLVAVSVAATVFCLTATVTSDGPERVELASGLIQFSADPDVSTAVRSLEAFLVAGVADVGGLLLALLWTAGFLPGFLEPANASVLLAKPAPRWALLAGKFLGVMTFAALQAVLFLGGTWLALGVRTGVWDLAYLLCLPLLLLHFAVFFSFSAMLAVATRSSVACVFGSVLFWVMCWGMNFGRHVTRIVPDMQGVTGVLASTTEAVYWLLPKPLDFQLILADGLQPGEVFGRLVSTAKLAEIGAWHPLASVIASVAAALMLLALAAYEFASADY